MIPNIQKPKDSIRNTIRTDKFSTVVGYKIKIQKSVAFLSTNYKLSEREIKKTIPFTIEWKNNKIARDKFNQGPKRLILQKL